MKKKKKLTRSQRLKRKFFREAEKLGFTKSEAQKVFERKYYKPRGYTLKQLRKKEKKITSPKYGDYTVRLYERTKKGRRIFERQVPISAFRAGRYYRVFLVNRRTKASRLLSFGRMHELPIVSKKFTKSLEKPVIHRSRFFTPKGIPKKAKGAWLPITKFYRKAEKNLNEKARVLRKENYQLRGAVLPLKRYYHPGLMVFSDTPLRRNLIVLEAYAHCIVAYDYPNIRWISARHIPLEFTRGVRLDHLADHLERKEELAGMALHVEHPKAEVQVLMIDGFIPTKFKEEKGGDTTTNKKRKHGKRTRSNKRRKKAH